MKMGFLQKKKKQEEVEPKVKVEKKQEVPGDEVEEDNKDEEEVSEEETKEEPKEPVKEVKEKVNKKEEPKHRYIVVKELPTQIVRETIDEDGTILHFITIEEALTQAIN